MKALTNYQRVSNYLVKIFKAVNEEYFNGELETPTITIQASVSSYGHLTISKVWHTADTSSYELNLSADYIARPIENVVATLIHESAHLYCLMNGLKDTSNNFRYHNRTFKRIAEEMGRLHIEKHNLYGWTITEPTEDTIDFIIKYGFEDIQISRGSQFTFVGIGGDKSGNGSPVKPPRKPTSTRKYICPCCGNSFRATKNINVLCMDCNEQFVLA